MKWKLFALFILCCTLAYSEDNVPETTAQPWTISRLEREFCGEDPIAGWNRPMFSFNDALMQYVVCPVSIGYTTVIPKPLIEIIENMCANLEYPRKVITCLGTAEWQGALDETVRFLVNSTIGIGGMFDPAKHWFHFYNTGSDCGRMFSVWGIDPGCTLVIPFYPAANNVRDYVAAIFDQALDARTYLPYSSWTWLNRIVLAEDKYSAVMSHTSSRYHMYRVVMLAQRKMLNELLPYRCANAQFEAYKKIQEDPALMPVDHVSSDPIPGAPGADMLQGYFFQDTYADTIRSLRFRPEAENDFWWSRRSAFNRDFSTNCEKRSVTLFEGVQPYEYLYRPPVTEEGDEVVNEETSRLLIVLPGIGSRKEGASAFALAEMFWKEGFHVVTTDSAFVHEMSQRVLGGRFPGFAPRDAKYMRELFLQIVKQLKAEKAIAEKTDVYLAGWSFGALHTVHIAALEKKDPKLNPVRFLAINPPVSMEHAIAQADTLAAVSVPWSREDAEKKILDCIAAALIMQDVQVPEKDSPANLTNLTREHGQYLVGMAFRSAIREMLLPRHLKSPIPGIRNGVENEQRMDLLHELDNLSFRDYAKIAFSGDKELPDNSLEYLMAESGLLKMGDVIRNDARIRFIHTADDFLLRKEDREFLTRAAGKRIIWFGRGGHLGNLYTAPVKEAIRRQLLD